jgi:hypothetical protein
MIKQHFPSIIPISTQSVQKAEYEIRESLDLLYLVIHAMESPEEFGSAHDGAVLTLNNMIQSLQEAKNLLDETGVTKACEKKGLDYSSPATSLDSALADHDKTLAHLSFQIDRFFSTGTPEKENAWRYLGIMTAGLDQVAKAINRPSPVPGAKPKPEGQQACRNTD